MMIDERFLRDVPLPDGLRGSDVLAAMKMTQELFLNINLKAGIHLPSIIQANNFSGVVSNVFTHYMGKTSKYKPFSDQRYPDLKNADTGIGLEVKASNKPMKGGESHNGHSGWHIILCYFVTENSIDFSQIEIAELIGFECANSDWSYQKSKRNSNNSQRTETYTTTNIGTSKLRDGTMYLTPEVERCISRYAWRRNKLSEVLPIPSFSIFA